MVQAAAHLGIGTAAIFGHVGQAVAYLGTGWVGAISTLGVTGGGGAILADRLSPGSYHIHPLLPCSRIRSLYSDCNLIFVY